MNPAGSQIPRRQRQRDSGAFCRMESPREHRPARLNKDANSSQGWCVASPAPHIFASANAGTKRKPKYPVDSPNLALHKEPPVLLDARQEGSRATRPNKIGPRNPQGPSSSSDRGLSHTSVTCASATSRAAPAASPKLLRGARAENRSEASGLPPCNDADAQPLCNGMGGGADDTIVNDSMDVTIDSRFVMTQAGKPSSHFRLGSEIGRGPFGSVYLALNLTTGQKVAIKCITLQGLTHEEVTQLMHEVTLVKDLSHPNIAKYEGMTRNEDTLSIALEYAEKGCLRETLNAIGRLTEHVAVGYVRNILRGLCYLHENHIAHGNLKAANILTTGEGLLKLSDFGLSPYLRTTARETETYNWMAPEVIEIRGASAKSDIWSLGCTITELLTGRPPYSDVSDSMAVMLRILADDGPLLPEGCSGPLQNFLAQCFRKHPDDRPTAEQLWAHDWLHGSWWDWKGFRRLQRGCSSSREVTTVDAIDVLQPVTLAKMSNYEMSLDSEEGYVSVEGEFVFSPADSLEHEAIQCAKDGQRRQSPATTGIETKGESAAAINADGTCRADDLVFIHRCEVNPTIYTTARQVDYGAMDFFHRSGRADSRQLRRTKVPSNGIELKTDEIYPGACPNSNKSPESPISPHTLSACSLVQDAEEKFREFFCEEAPIEGEAVARRRRVGGTTVLDGAGYLSVSSGGVLNAAGRDVNHNHHHHQQTTYHYLQYELPSLEQLQDKKEWSDGRYRRSSNRCWASCLLQ